jgi:hypothetical protein
MLITAPNIQICTIHVLSGIEAIPAPNGGYLRCAQARTNYTAPEEGRLRRSGACVRRW